MLKRDRRLVATLGIGTASAALLVVLSLSAYQSEQAIERDAAAKARHDYGAYQRDCERLVPPGPMVVDCMIEQAKTAHGEQHAEADLRAQQDMSSWALVLMWLGSVGTLMSAAGIFLVYRNLVETREIGQNQTRAFVHATEARLYVFLPANKLRAFGNPRMDHSVVVTFVNTGATPAVDLDAAAKLWVEQTGRADQPISLEFDQPAVVDALVNGSPTELRFKLAHNEFRPPDVAPSNELGLFGLGAMDWSSSSAASEAAESEKASRGGLRGILATFFDSKYVKCRGEILYSDMFGTRFRTEFYFEYLGAPKDGGFDMIPVRGGLKMFQRAQPGERAKARKQPPIGLSSEAMTEALKSPKDFTGEPDPDAPGESDEPK